MKFFPRRVVQPTQTRKDSIAPGVRFLSAVILSLSLWIYPSVSLATNHSPEFKALESLIESFEGISNQRLSENWDQYWVLVESPIRIDERNKSLEEQIRLKNSKINTLRRYHGIDRYDEEIEIRKKIESLNKEKRELSRIRYQWVNEKYARLHVFADVDPIRARRGVEKLYQEELSEAKKAKKDLGGVYLTWSSLLSKVGSRYEDDAFKAVLLHPSKVLSYYHRNDAVDYFRKKKSVAPLAAYVRDDTIPGHSNSRIREILDDLKDVKDPKMNELLIELSTHSNAYVSIHAAQMHLNREKTHQAYEVALATMDRLGPQDDIARRAIIRELVQYYDQYASQQKVRFTRPIPISFMKKILLEPPVGRDQSKEFYSKIEIARIIIQSGGNPFVISELTVAVGFLLDWILTEDYKNGNQVYHHLARALALSLGRVDYVDDGNAEELRRGARVLESSIIRYFHQLAEKGLSTAFADFVGNTGYQSTANFETRVDLSPKRAGLRELAEAFAKVPYFNERFLHNLYALGLTHHTTSLAHRIFANLYDKEEIKDFPKEVFLNWIDAMSCWKEPDASQVGKLVTTYVKDTEDAQVVIEYLYGTKFVSCMAENVRESVALFLLNLGVVPVSSSESNIASMKDAYALIGDFFQNPLTPMSLGYPASYVYDVKGKRIALPHPGGNFADQYHNGRLERGKWTNGFLPLQRIRKAVVRANDTHGPLRLAVYLNQLDAFLISSAAQSYLELNQIHPSYLRDLRLPKSLFRNWGCNDVDSRTQNVSYRLKGNRSKIDNCLITDSFRRYRSAILKAMNRDDSAESKKNRREERTAIHMRLIQDYEVILGELGMQNGLPDDFRLSNLNAHRYGYMHGRINEEEKQRFFIGDHVDQLWEKEILPKPDRLEALRVIDIYGDSDDSNTRTKATFKLIANAYFQAIVIDELEPFSQAAREKVQKQIQSKLNEMFYERVREKIRTYRDALVVRAEQNRVRDILERVGANELLATLLHSEIEGHYLQGHWGTLKSQYAIQIKEDYNQAIFEGIMLAVAETAVLMLVTGGVGLIVKAGAMAVRAGVATHQMTRAVRIGAALHRIANAVVSTKAGLYLAGPSLIARALRFIPRLVGKKGLIAGAAAYTFLYPQKVGIYHRRFESVVRHETPIDSYREDIVKALWKRRLSGSNDSDNLQRFMSSPAQKFAEEKDINDELSLHWALTTSCLFLPSAVNGISNAGRSLIQMGQIAPSAIAELGVYQGLKATIQAGIPVTWTGGFLSGGFGVVESSCHFTAAAFLAYHPVQWLEEQKNLNDERARNAEKHRGSIEGSILLLMYEARKMRTSPEKILEIETNASAYLSSKKREHLVKLSQVLDHFTTK